MKKTPDTRFVFLDLETTGLDPDREQILEIGIIVVSLELEEIGAWSRVVPVHGEPEDLIESEFVREMHTKNGLLRDVRNEDLVRRLGGFSLPGMISTIQHDALDFLRLHDFVHGTATLTGYCPHFDRSFLKVHAPALERFFTYRMIDVSTLRGLTRRWTRPEIDAIRKAKVGETAHRVLEDCREALAELREYRSGWPL